MKTDVSISDFLPEFELVPIMNDAGQPSGAFAKVLGFDELSAIVALGTADMIAFGCRLLAKAAVKADGTPLGDESEWTRRATFKAKDKLLSLITLVGEVNGVLGSAKVAELGNDSKPIGEQSSNSSFASDSVAPVESCEKL